MITLAENIIQAWEDRDGPIILTTVNEKGVPNSVYATSISLYDNCTIVIADNYLNKTRENILANCTGSILFMTTAGKAYQFKGSFTYHKYGEIFENMKKWNPKRLPGHAAVAFTISEVYSGSDKLA